MNPRLSVILADIYVLTSQIFNAFSFFTCAEKQCASERSKAYPFPRGWHVLALLIFPISAMAQTTIVVRRTPREIVVGADSRVTIGNRTIDIFGRAQDAVTYSTTCKIVVEGNRAFVVSGYLGGDETGTDITSAARAALGATGSIVAVANSYSSRMQGPLTDRLEKLRRFDLESYRKSTRNPDGKIKDVSQVIFMAMENGIPKLAARSFITTNDESASVSLSSVSVNVPNKALSQNLDVTALGGHHAEIDKYISDNPFWRKNGNVAGVIVLIKIMETAHPEEVGGPIDILRVTKDGAEWIQHKKECPDIEKPAPKPAPKPTKRRPRRP